MTIYQETAIGATGSTQVMSKVNILQLSCLEIPVRLIVILSRLTHATNVERCLSLKFIPQSYLRPSVEQHVHDIIWLGVIYLVVLHDAPVTPMIRNKAKYSKKLINIPPASLEK